MQIDNTYLTNRRVGRPDEAAAGGEPIRRGEPQALPDASVHVPSPELLELMARVEQAPEVRPEVLERVAQRLASGFYLTREAAEQTADILRQSAD